MQTKLYYTVSDGPNALVPYTLILGRLERVRDRAFDRAKVLGTDTARARARRLDVLYRANDAEHARLCA